MSTANDTYEYPQTSALRNGYFRNAADLAEMKNLTDQQKTNLLISMRDTLERMPDGKYEFAIFRNGIILDSPGMRNPAIFTKRGFGVIDDSPGVGAVPFTDFRDIAGATYGFMSSGKIPANELTFVLRRMEPKSSKYEVFGDGTPIYSGEDRAVAAKVFDNAQYGSVVMKKDGVIVGEKKSDIYEVFVDNDKIYSGTSESDARSVFYVPEADVVVRLMKNGTEIDLRAPKKSLPAETNDLPSEIPTDNLPDFSSGPSPIVLGIVGAIAGKLLGKSGLAAVVGAGTGLTAGYLMKKKFGGKYIVKSGGNIMLLDFVDGKLDHAISEGEKVKANLAFIINKNPNARVVPFVDGVNYERDEFWANSPGFNISALKKLPGYDPNENLFIAESDHDISFLTSVAGMVGITDKPGKNFDPVKDLSALSECKIYKIKYNGDFMADAIKQPKGSVMDFLNKAVDRSKTYTPQQIADLTKL